MNVRIRILKKISDIVEDYRIQNIDFNLLLARSDEELTHLLSLEKEKLVAYVRLYSSKAFLETPTKYQQGVFEIIETTDILEKEEPVVDTALSSNVYQNEKGVEVVKAVANALTTTLSLCASAIAVDATVSKNYDLLEFTDTVAQMNRKFDIMQYVLRIAKNEHVLQSGNALEIVKTVGQSIDKDHALRAIIFIEDELTDFKGDNILDRIREIAGYSEENPSFENHSLRFCTKEDISSFVATLEKMPYSEKKLKKMVERNSQQPLYETNTSSESKKKILLNGFQNGLRGSK